MSGTGSRHAGERDWNVTMKAIALCVVLVFAGAASVQATKESPPHHTRPAHLRTDEEIKFAVVKGLLANPYVSAARIRVSVRRGFVTLRGAVKTKEAKKMAGQVARAVPGVRAVRNQLVVDFGKRSSLPRNAAVRAGPESFATSFALVMFGTSSRKTSG